MSVWGAKRQLSKRWSGERKTDLELGICPSGNLNDHVEDGLLLVGVEGNIVERRDGDAVLLDVDAVLEGVGSSDFADAVSHGG